MKIRGGTGLSASVRSFRSLHPMWSATTARRRPCWRVRFRNNQSKHERFAGLRPNFATKAARSSRRTSIGLESSDLCALSFFQADCNRRCRRTGSGKPGRSTAASTVARIQASGIRPQGGQTAHLRIGKSTGEDTNEGLIELDILAPEN